MMKASLKEANRVDRDEYELGTSSSLLKIEKLFETIKIKNFHVSIFTRSKILKICC